MKKAGLILSALGWVLMFVSSDKIVLAIIGLAMVTLGAVMSGAWNGKGNEDARPSELLRKQPQ